MCIRDRLKGALHDAGDALYEAGDAVADAGSAFAGYVAEEAPACLLYTSRCV